MMYPIIIIYGVFLILGGLVATIVISLGDNGYDSEKVFWDGKNFFLCVFMYQSSVWQHCESLNLVGKLIIEIIVTLLVLPLNIIIFLMLCILEILIFIIACYLFIFGKEHKWKYLKNMKIEYEREQEVLKEIFKDDLL